MRPIATLLALLSLTGCSLLTKVVTPDHTIDAAQAGPLILDVCDQHDESVQRDSTLVPAEREQALRSTTMLREIVEAAMKEPLR